MYPASYFGEKMIFLLLLSLTVNVWASSNEGNDPSQIHLALGGPSEMSVTWFTADDALKTPICRYGDTEDDLKHSSVGSSLVYLPGYGAHHSVVLTGLLSERRYFYQCGDETNKALSDVFHFNTPPTAVSTTTDPLSFLIFGGWFKFISFLCVFYETPFAFQIWVTWTLINAPWAFLAP